MPAYGWDAILGHKRMPAVGQTVIGEFFTIPLSSQAVSFHIPALAAAATVKLQALNPKGSDQSSTEEWRDVKVFNLAAGGVQALSALPSDTVVTLPTAATGAGVFRLVASADQSASPVYISILISRL